MHKRMQRHAAGHVLILEKQQCCTVHVQTSCVMQSRRKFISAAGLEGWLVHTQKTFGCMPTTPCRLCSRNRTNTPAAAAAAAPCHTRRRQAAICSSSCSQATGCPNNASGSTWQAHTPGKDHYKQQHQHQQPCFSVAYQWAI